MRATAWQPVRAMRVRRGKAVPARGGASAGAPGQPGRIALRWPGTFADAVCLYLWARLRHVLVRSLPQAPRSPGNSWPGLPFSGTGQAFFFGM